MPANWQPETTPYGGHSWTAPNVFTAPDSSLNSGQFIAGTLAAPMAIDVTFGYTGLQSSVVGSTSGSADALISAVSGSSIVTTGTRGMPTGGYFYAEAKGTWTPGAFDTGPVGIWTQATSSRAGSIFGASFNVTAQTTAGSLIRGLEIDMEAKVGAAPASKVGIEIVSPNSDVSQATLAWASAGVNAPTIIESFGVRIVTIGAGVGLDTGLIIGKVSGGSEPITSTGRAIGILGVTCGVGIDMRGSSFTNGAVLLANAQYFTGQMAAGTIKSLLGLDASDICQVGGGQPTAFTPGNPYFKVKMSGDQTGIVSATWTLASFNTSIYARNTTFDTTNKRHTPTIAGYYRYHASGLATTNSAADATVTCSLYKNGAFFMPGVVRTATVAGGTQFYVDATEYMNGSTDYMDVRWFITTSASTATVQAADGGGAIITIFEGYLV